MTRESIVTVAGERYRAVEDPPHTFTIFLQAGPRLGQIVRVPAAGNQREYFQTEYRRDHVTTWTDAVLTLHRDYLGRDVPAAVPPPPPLPAVVPLAAQAAPQAPPPAAEGAQDDAPPADAVGAVPPHLPPPTPAAAEALPPAKVPAEIPQGMEWLPTVAAAARLGISRGELNKRITRGAVTFEERRTARNTKAYFVLVPQDGPSDDPNSPRPGAEYWTAGDTQAEIQADPPGPGQWRTAKDAAAALGKSYSQLASQAKRGQLGIFARKVTSADERGHIREVWAIWVPTPPTKPAPQKAAAALASASAPKKEPAPVVRVAEAQVAILAALHAAGQPQSAAQLMQAPGVGSHFTVTKALAVLEQAGQVVATGQPRTIHRRYGLPDPWSGGRAEAARLDAAAAPTPAPAPQDDLVWVRTPVAGQYLGVSREEVGRRAREGVLPARRVSLGKRQIWEVGLRLEQLGSAHITLPAAETNDPAPPAAIREAGAETTETRAQGLIEWVGFQTAVNRDDSPRRIDPRTFYTPPDPAPQPTLREMFQLLWETHDGQDALLIAVKDALRPTLLALPALRDALDSANAEQDQANTRIMKQLDRMYDFAESTHALAMEASTRTQALLDQAEQTAAAEAAATWMETTSGHLLGQGRAIQLLAQQVAAQTALLTELRESLARLEAASAAPANSRQSGGWSLLGRKSARE